MNDYRRTSKLLALVLRHEPEAIGLTLDEYGWADVEALLMRIATRGHRLNRDQLAELVRNNDKARYAFSDDGQRIRAVQGHSIPVILGYTPIEPPDVLFHGTVERFMDSIRAQGLVPGERQYVHLSHDRQTAQAVGARRGRPVILEIAAGAMHRAGHAFLRADNGVWLTKAVPAAFFSTPADAAPSTPPQAAMPRAKPRQD